MALNLEPGSTPSLASQIGGITWQDLKAYLTEPTIESQGTAAPGDQYTFTNGPTGSVSGQLTNSQLNRVLALVGFTPTQVTKINQGSGGGGWLGDAIQGITGGLAALGPEANAGGDLLDLFGIGSKVTEIKPAGESDTTPAGTPEEEPSTTSKGGDSAAPSAASKLLQTGSNAALLGIWGDITGDAKYAAIWVGLGILGIALILIGLTRNGVKAPIPMVVPV